MKELCKIKELSNALFNFLEYSNLNDTVDMLFFLFDIGKYVRKCIAILGLFISTNY